MLARALIAVLALATAARATSSFVEFESGQVRPLTLSPDGSRLFAVNTPDNRLEIFDVEPDGNLTPRNAVTYPTHTVAVGLEPVAVAARTNTEVWVVNHLSDSVSIVDLSGAAPRVRRTLLVGDEPRDIVFAGANRAFITCAHRGQQRTDTSLAGVPGAGDPQLTTAGIDRADVWVFDATSDTTLDQGATPTLGGKPLSIVTLFGDTPRALAVSPLDGTVYAAVFHSGNRTTALSEGVVCNGGAGAASCTPPNGDATEPGGLPAPNKSSDNVTGPETGLVVKFNSASGHWEDQVSPPRNWDHAVRFWLPDDDVFRIDPSTNPPVAKPSAPHAGQPFAGVGTVLFNMAVNPMSGKVYVTNGDARNEVRFEGQRSPCGTPSSVVGHLSEARITVLDPSSGTVTPCHLNRHLDSGASSYCTVPSPAGTVDKSLATPLGMAVTGDGQTLYVAAFGSSNPSSPGTGGIVGVFQTSEIETCSFTPSASTHILLHGGGASGVVLNEAKDRLYVLTRFTNEVSVVDTTTAPGSEVQHLPVFNPEPPVVKVGRPFLYDATLTSSNGEAACASCHIFGDFDSLAWDLGNPDDVNQPNDPNPFRTPPGDGGLAFFHPLKGPMTTQTLRGLVNNGPMHWRGDRTGGFVGQPLDSTLAFEAFNVAFAGLLGRSGPLTATQMQQFTEFMLEVLLPPNPIRNVDNTVNGAASNGRTFFNGPTSDLVQTCNGCHVLDPANGHFGTDGLSSFENETQDFKIPHLRNLYQKVGMFGMPAIQFVNAGNNGCITGTAGCPTAVSQPDQVRGFGFLHDGSIDTVFRFHHATVFNAGFGGATNVNCGTTNADLCRRNVEQFMLAFDSDLAPIVGQQITLTGANGATVGSRIVTMRARAAAGECDVVVKGNVAGEQRGWTCAGTACCSGVGCGGGSLFQSDRSGETETATSLSAKASVAGQELTYIAVPPGSGIRIGIDRDEDGYFDADEITAGSDPADPTSVPPGGTTSTTTTVPGGTTTTSTTLPPPGPSKCTGKKFNVAGKKVRNRTKCYSKAVTAGTTADGECLTTASDKFSKSWTKLEVPGNDCRTSGDAAAIESDVDGFVGGLANVLEPSGPQPSRCTSKKLQAAAKKASAMAKCYGKAATKGIGVDSNCLLKADSKFLQTWTKLEAPGNDCLTSGDESNIKTGVDAFVIDQLVPTLQP
jgi:hypothetical protein